jgi:hypothetical protein
MQKNKVKAGVIYGYATGTSEYRNAQPAIVLDTTGLWTWGAAARGRYDIKYKPSTEQRYTKSYDSWSSYHGPHGFLVLIGSNYDEEERDTHLSRMKALYQEFAATEGNADDVNAFAQKIKAEEGMSLGIVNNRWLEGDYVEAKNAEDERRKARDAQYKAERDRAAAERALMDELGEILSAKLERQVPVTSDRGWGDTRASVKLSDLAEYFGIKSVTDRL